MRSQSQKCTRDVEWCDALSLSRSPRLLNSTKWTVPSSVPMCCRAAVTSNLQRECHRFRPCPPQPRTSLEDMDVMWGLSNPGSGSKLQGSTHGQHHYVAEITAFYVARPGGSIGRERGCRIEGPGPGTSGNPANVRKRPVGSLQISICLAASNRLRLYERVDGRTRGTQPVFSCIRTSPEWC